MDKKIHLGIIPDGNRRFCKKKGIAFNELIDHWFNNMIVKNVKKAIDTDFKILNNMLQVNELSLYISSIDNIVRDDGSVDLGYELIRKIYNLYTNKNEFFTQEQCEKLEKQHCKVSFNMVGDLELVPEDIRKIIEEFSDSDDKTFMVNLAIAYDYNKDLRNFGSKEDKRYNRDQKQIDCIFRSGNEQRLSGFFPCHALYSELIFSEKLWPEISISDIENVLKIFNNRKRRFGI